MWALLVIRVQWFHQNQYYPWTDFANTGLGPGLKNVDQSFPTSSVLEDIR